MTASLLVILCGITVISANPCDQYMALPFADLRFVNNKLHPADIPVDDLHLQEGWYRVGDEDMPTKQPEPMSCGTKIPLWLKGTIPTPEELIVTRTAGIGGYAGSYSIKIKNCGLFRVYYLVPTSGIEEGYCFGEGENGPRPDYKVPLGMKVAITLRRDDFSSVYTAGCIFHESSNEPLLYQVTWYVDGKFLMSLPAQRYQHIDKIELDENNLKYMGRRVSCSVRARYSPKGPPGISTTSPDFFMGIEVISTVVDVTREEGGTIRFRPTVPIGCTPPSATSCKLRIVMQTLNEDACDSLGVLGNSDCGVEVETSDWNREFEIAVVANVPDVYEYRKVFEVKLSTLEQYRHHLVWSRYQLPPIRVNVVDKTVPLANKICYAQNDPHLKTFDGRTYDIHNKGTFVLYRSKKHSIQVQSYFQSCNGGYPHCVCGVAVQAGRDVFVFDRCNGFYDYQFCLDGILDVRRDPKSSRKYRIYTPTGTMIEVSDHNCCGGSFVTVSVRPSKRDIDASEGLCGTLNMNHQDDFLKSDGKLATDANTFSMSWRIDRAGEADLFSRTLNHNKLQKWGQQNELCSCEYNRTIEIPVSPKVVCKSNLVSDCMQNARLEKRIDTCKVHTVLRGKRSLRSINDGQRRRDTYLLNLKKRSTNRVNMDKQQAVQYCTDSLTKSAAFNLCGTVPNVNISDSINICALDILLTNTTDWTDSSREGLKDSCLMELQMNTTLQEKGPGDTPSLAEKISEISCPGECSGLGTCNQGECQCPEGFGGSDCAIDLSIPPFFDALMDEGLCDKQHWVCDAALALGNDFVTADLLKCNMKSFSIDKTGKVSEEEDQVVTADIQTMTSLFCPFPSHRHKRDTEQLSETFVAGYHVSLSNDGLHFGESRKLYIFDATCQIPVAVGNSYEFTLKSGYCFINNECKKDGEVNPHNDCHVCDTTNDSYSWSLRKEITKCVPVKTVTEEPSSYLWVIGLVAGLLVAGIIIGVILWKRRTKGVTERSKNMRQSPSDNKDSTQEMKMLA
ncbi:von Willebrand factor D and EGF domain-containing protein-like [Ylistrum balloti]|uniref:von Willebrand factor D and EGF domain-containing protein-like n=1 Tax=Ylistrum balloti TaxID=509963 RepID=UPI002905F4E9|nr:von Willebrand factor D and EGF domain-containing protein-like [Ylistrum balloti]